MTQLLKSLALDCFWIKSCAAVDLGLCCQGQSFLLLTSLSHYFIFSVHKDVGLGMLDHSTHSSPKVLATNCGSILFGQDRFCYIFLVGVGSALWSVNPPHPIHYWSTAGAQRGDQPAQHSYLHLKFAREVYIVTTTLKLYTVGNPHTPYSKSQMTRQICHLVHRSV